jgi:hypothetical protein
MTRKLAISVPDDVAERLDREPNVSAYVSEAVRRMIVSERVREGLAATGIEVTPERVAAAADELAALHASVTPQLRAAAEEVLSRVKRPRRT